MDLDLSGGLAWGALARVWDGLDAFGVDLVATLDTTAASCEGDDVEGHEGLLLLGSTNHAEPRLPLSPPLWSSPCCAAVGGLGSLVWPRCKMPRDSEPSSPRGIKP